MLHMAYLRKPYDLYIYTLACDIIMHTSAFQCCDNTCIYPDNGRIDIYYFYEAVKCMIVFFTGISLFNTSFIRPHYRCYRWWIILSDLNVQFLNYYFVFKYFYVTGMWKEWIPSVYWYEFDNYALSSQIIGLNPGCIDVCLVISSSF